MSADHAADLMARDRASAALGMRVVESRPGFATVRMRVRDDMVNGYGVAHGGFVFAVADTAFAIACSAPGTATLAAGADIVFLRAAHAGETLTATATLRSARGRSSVCDVQVTGADGEVVAEFRGRGKAARSEHSLRAT